MTFQNPQDWQNGQPPPSPPLAPASQPAYGSSTPEYGPYPTPYPAAAFPPVSPMQRSWWSRLPTWGKATLITGAVVLLLCGGLGILGAIVGPTPESESLVDATAVDSPSGQATDSPEQTLTTQGSATTEPSPSAAAKPTIEKRTITEKQSIPFAIKKVSDSSLPKGTTKVRTRGVAGVKTLTYEVTLTNGVQTSKKLLRQQVTKQPVTQVVAVGTKSTEQCDPNYSGACVPIASDVDCAGGSGDGPAYVQGPVIIIGTDKYRLDNDGDGIGCES